MKVGILVLLLVGCGNGDRERELLGELGNANARVAQLEEELAACQSGAPAADADAPPDGETAAEATAQEPIAWMPSVATMWRMWPAR